MIDLADARLTHARELGADVVIDDSEGDPVAQVMGLTYGLGVDLAIRMLEADPVAHEPVPRSGSLAVSA